MTVERCGKCKSVYWVGLQHGCVVDELHPVLRQSFQEFKDEYTIRAPIEIKARVRRVE